MKLYFAIFEREEASSSCNVNSGTNPMSHNRKLSEKNCLMSGTALKVQNRNDARPGHLTTS